MSRVSYSEDEDFPGQWALWQANLDRQIHGRKGQATMADLRDALLALPTKRLIANKLVANGEVCTVGALLRQRGMDDKAMEQATRECTCGHVLADHDVQSGMPGSCPVCRQNAAEFHERWDGDPLVTWSPKTCDVFTEDEYEDDETTITLAVGKGVPRKIAWKLVELNDIEMEGVTPERRYDRVLRWVEEQLSPVSR